VLLGQPDNVLKEFQIALAMLDDLQLCLDDGKEPVGKLQTILPVLVGKRSEPGSQTYPGMTDFFRDGSNGKYVDKLSASTTKGVVEFLQSKNIFVTKAVRNRTVKATMDKLLEIQGCKLWKAAKGGVDGKPIGVDVTEDERKLFECNATCICQSLVAGDTRWCVCEVRVFKAQAQALAEKLYVVIDRATAAQSQLQQHLSEQN